MTLPINQIINGDCLEVMQEWPDNCVDLVLTDPPYGVDLGNHVGAKETRSGLLVKKGGYNDTYTNFKYSVVPSIKKALNISQRGMVFCVPPNMWLLPAPDAMGGVFVSGAVGRNKWGWSTLIHCLLYGIAPNLNLGAKSTAIKSNASAEKYEHPAVKPLVWLLWAVALGSKPNDLILDPFCGSGTTCVAAKMLGRHYIGIDKNPEYCQIARQRLEAVDTGVPVKEQRKGQTALFPMEKI